MKIPTPLLLALWLDLAQSWVMPQVKRSSPVLWSSSSDDEPAPVNGFTSQEEETTEAEAEEEVAVESPIDNTEEISTEVTNNKVDENLLFLQSLGAITSRGEQATTQQLEAVRSVVAELESSNPTTDPVYAKELLQGTWELSFTDTKQLFRSSPFFMAGRAVCETKEQVDQYNWFCDMHRKALAISTIGPVRQVISPKRLVSEFEVQAGAVPFLNDFTPFSYSGGLPFTVDGALVSSADWTAVDGNTFELFMDTVEVKGSNIPGLRQVLDGGLKLQSRVLGDALEQNLAGYQNPRPLVKITFLSKKVRISRDQDDNIFVHVKTSDFTEPTDYSTVDADLGVGRLLEGFNDAVSRIHL